MAASNSSERSRKRSPQKSAAGRQAKTGGSRGSSKRASQAAVARQLRRDARAGRPSSRGSARPQPASKSNRGGARTDGLSGLTEQLANRILKPLGLVVLSRERIAETLSEAALAGRLTRSDAERLVSELVQLGRQQTEELLADLDRTLGRGAAGLLGVPRLPGTVRGIGSSHLLRAIMARAPQPASWPPSAVRAGPSGRAGDSRPDPRSAGADRIEPPR